MNILADFSMLSTSLLCNVDKSIIALPSIIKPVANGYKMAGVARTVSVDTDYLSVIDALNNSRKDEVLIINCLSNNLAFAGELFVSEAIRKQMAGLIVNGGVRDINEIRLLGLPVYARFITPRAGTCNKLGDMQEPINIDGVMITPGDYIFGDDDGIIVVDQNKDIISLFELARILGEKERQVLSKIRNNESLIDLTNFKEHREKVVKNKDSNLLFVIEKH